MRLLGQSLTLLCSAALLAGAVAGSGAARADTVHRAEDGHDHRVGPRLRPRPRHVAVGRPGRRAAGPRPASRSSTSTTPAPARDGRRHGLGADHRRHHPGRRGEPGPGPRGQEPDEEEDATGSPSSGRGPRGWRLQPKGANTLVSYKTDRWRKLTKFAGDAEFSAGGAPITLKVPGRQGRPTAACCAPPRATPSTSLRSRPTCAASCPRRCPRSGRRPRCRPRRSPRAPTPPSSGPTPAPPGTSSSTTPPAPRSTAARRRAARVDAAIKATRGRSSPRRRAGVHAVLVQQRRLDLGRQPALPRGQGGPLRRRRWLDPHTQLDRHAQRQDHRGEVAPGR